MKRSNLSALAEIEQLRREVVRLEEGFRLEKDEVLFEGTRKALVDFRERSRTHYQPEIRRISGRLHRVVTLHLPGEEWSEEVLDVSRTLQRRIDEVLGRFIGTPNRLMRNSDVIERLSSDRGSNAFAASPAAPEDDPGMIKTDPPIPCPVCGAILMTDRDFTLLSCPGCGAGESLEIEPPVDAGGGETPGIGPPVDADGGEERDGESTS